MVLPLSVGGERIDVRVLTIEESDAWLRKLTASIDVNMAGLGGDADGLAALLGLSGGLCVDLIEAYDLDHVLPADLRSVMSKGEARAALEAMATAEDPFGEGASRLVAEVFGAPSRFLAVMSQAAMDAASPSDGSPNGASGNGASTTSETSAPPGPTSGSSSSGSTVKNGKPRRPARPVTPQPTV